MKKHIKYKTQGVCSRKIEFDIIDECVYNVKATPHKDCRPITLRQHRTSS